MARSGKWQETATAAASIVALTGTVVSLLEKRSAYVNLLLIIASLGILYAHYASAEHRRKRGALPFGVALILLIPLWLVIVYPRYYTPVVDTFFPGNPKAGDEVAIVGSNFGYRAAEVTVLFNGLRAARVNRISDHIIRARVPMDAIPGPVTVIRNGPALLFKDLESRHRWCDVAPAAGLLLITEEASTSKTGATVLFSLRNTTDAPITVYDIQVATLLYSHTQAVGGETPRVDLGAIALLPEHPARRVSIRQTATSLLNTGTTVSLDAQEAISFKFLLMNPTALIGRFRCLMSVSARYHDAAGNKRIAYSDCVYRLEAIVGRGYTEVRPYPWCQTTLETLQKRDLLRLSRSGRTPGS